MNIEFMQKALELAANADIDIPIGAVIVKGNEIIASAANTRERHQKTLGHAEINAVSAANEKLGSWRLDDCEIYVTLEPCPMCAAAILFSRIKAVYFGAYDVLYGALGSKLDMREILNINTEVKGGILEKECSDILKQYFPRLRHKLR